MSATLNYSDFPDFTEYRLQAMEGSRGSSVVRLTFERIDDGPEEAFRPRQFYREIEKAEIGQQYQLGDIIRVAFTTENILMTVASRDAINANEDATDTPDNVRYLLSKRHPSDISAPDPTDAKEALAALAHQSWSRYMAYFLGQLHDEEGLGHLTVSRTYVGNLRRLITTPYSQLAEAAKESDREEAGHIWGLVELLLLQTRIHELYLAMVAVEKFGGASPEQTATITALGERHHALQAQVAEWMARMAAQIEPPAAQS